MAVALTGPGSLRQIPGIAKQILVEATAVAPKQSEGTAIALENGDLLFMYAEFFDTALLPESERPAFSPMRGSALGDDAYARINAITSRDGGRTWSAPRLVVDDRDAQVNCISPALTRMPDGRLLLAYSWRNSGNRDKAEAARRVRFSDDEGQSWSDPIRVTPDDGTYHTGCHDRAYTLSSGRVLLQCHTLFPSVATKQMGVYVARSDDNGATWALSDVLTEPTTRYFEEGSLVERADGSLLMALRSSLGNAFFTESGDGGATWSTPRPSGVVAPMAPTLLTRFPGSDDLLMLWNSNYNPDDVLGGLRCPLLCAVSRDNGRTWGLPKALETDPAHWWEYPGVFFRGDEALVHYRRVIRPRRPEDLARTGFGGWPDQRCDLILARVPIAWFYER